MNVTSFSEQRNIKAQAVFNYISRHPELFDGHVSKEGNSTVLDEVALSVLDKKYPLPSPVTVINGVTHEDYQEKLNQLNEVLLKLEEKNNIIVQLQQQLNETRLQLASKDSQMALLEFKEETKDKIIDEQQKSLEMAENIRNELEREVVRLKNRGLWDRIRNK